MEETFGEHYFYEFGENMNKSYGMENVEIGKLFRKQRERKQLTREELSKKVGLSQGQLTLIELGRSKSSTSLLIRYCRELGCTPNELLDWECDENQDAILPKLEDYITELSMDRQKSLLSLLTVLDCYCMMIEGVYYKLIVLDMDWDW